jgi:hypothetical protein
MSLAERWAVDDEQHKLENVYPWPKYTKTTERKIRYVRQHIHNFNLVFVNYKKRHRSLDGIEEVWGADEIAELRSDIAELERLLKELEAEQAELVNCLANK